MTNFFKNVIGDWSDTPLTDNKNKTNKKTTPTVITTTTTSYSAGKKDEFMAKLRDVMLKHNIPGPDYLEFASALKEMNDQPGDIATKLKFLFMGFKAQGLTAEKLIETGNVYIDIFDKVLSEFQSEVENATKNELTSKNQQIANLTTDNTNIDKQIAELTSKKSTNLTTINNLNNEVNQISQKISGQEADFKSAYTDLVSEIKTNQELIKQHLIK